MYPPQHIKEDIIKQITDYTCRLAKELKVIGLVNIQYVIHEGKVYVIEVNPRSSRTVPYISKVTGIPIVDLALRCSIGEKLKYMGYGTGLHKPGEYIAVKVPVFSFEKLHDADIHLGPEMKSTGEVLGIAKTFDEALLKGLVAAGYTMKKSGGVFISVRDTDKEECVSIAKRFADLGFDIYATIKTAMKISRVVPNVKTVPKINEASFNPLTLIESGKIDYVISTSKTGRLPARDSVKIRRKTVERGIPCLTSTDTANALAQCLESDGEIKNVYDINNIFGGSNR